MFGGGGLDFGRLNWSAPRAAALSVAAARRLVTASRVAEIGADGDWDWTANPAILGGGVSPSTMELQLALGLDIICTHQQLHVRRVAAGCGYGSAAGFQLSWTLSAANLHGRLADCVGAGAMGGRNAEMGGGNAEMGGGNRVLGETVQRSQRPS